MELLYIMRNGFFKKTSYKEYVRRMKHDTSLSLIITVTRRCVLNCLYCYARDPNNVQANEIIGDDILEKVIHDAFDVRHRNILFEFTGGEALLGGIPFYKRVLQLQKKYARNDKEYSNCVQTSGALYDEKLYDFLIDNKIRPSLTIDGPKDLHDLHRPMTNGKSSFDTVLKSYNYIRKKQGWCGALVTITKNSLHRANDIVSLYKKLKVRDSFTNPYYFDPSKAVKDNSIGLTCDEFAQYFISQYEHMLKLDDPKIQPDYLTSNMKLLCGLDSRTKCSQGGRCLSNLVNIGNGGEVYMCCRYLGNNDVAYGNIMEKPLKHLISLKNPVLKKIVHDRVKAINHCKEKKCMYLPLCNGGCPYNSYLASGYKDFAATDCLCEGKYKLFSYIDESLNKYGVKTITDVFTNKKGGKNGYRKSKQVCRETAARAQQ